MCYSPDLARAIEEAAASRRQPIASVRRVEAACDAASPAAKSMAEVTARISSRDRIFFTGAATAASEPFLDLVSIMGFPSSCVG